MKRIPVGAFPQKEGTLFRVWAPQAKTVEVLLPTAVSLNPEERGYFSAFVKGVGEGQLYKFRLDGTEEFPDPTSRYQPEGPSGPSQVINHDFSWTDPHWTGVPLKELVIYELHVGTFTSEGTFAGVQKHLPRLRDLGVNALEIMPIGQFSGKRNWGYDGVGLFAPQNSYGGPDISPVELKKLVNACHEQGIAVILDVVYNHLGPEGNYLAKWGPYFQDRYKTSWGEAVNFDGAGSDEVRNFFLENVRQWLQDYHIDGLRLDAIHAIFDMSADPFLGQLSKFAHDLGKKEGREIHIIAESDSNDSRILTPVLHGGFGLDGQWADDLHHVIHTMLTGERQGYYSDYGDPKHLAQVFKNGILFQGEYSNHRQRSHGRSYQNIERHRLVVCTQNHDQIGNRRDGERLASLVSYEKVKAAIAWVFLSGSLPLIFMGEEIAEPNPFLYFIDPEDPRVLQTVREGRKKEFASFHWDQEPPDPGAEETFLRSRPDWNRLDKDPRAAEMTRYYQTLIDLSKWIRQKDFLKPEATEVELLASEKILSIHGRGSDQNLHLYFSLDESNQDVRVPIQRGELIFDSAASAQGSSFTDRTLKMKPFSVVVLCE